MIARFVQIELSRCQLSCKKQGPSQLEIGCKNLFRMRIELGSTTIRVLGASPLVGAVDTEVLAVLRDHGLYGNRLFSHGMVGPEADRFLAEHFVGVLAGAIAAVEEKVISGEIRTPADRQLTPTNSLKRLSDNSELPPKFARIS